MWLRKVTLLMLLLACVAITMAQKPAGTVPAVKVCPHGQAIMTSSNTPLACLTDADCVDAAYRCVQRQRYAISKVCCKAHRNKKPHKPKPNVKPRQKREEKSW